MTDIKRHWDWEDRLKSYLDTRKDWAFKWGEFDCAAFVAGAVKAMTDFDAFAGFAGTYDSEAGSKAALASNGFKTLHQAVISFTGPSKPIAKAKRGDIVIKDSFTLGICIGKWSYFVGEEGSYEGLIHVPTRDCKKAYPIPFDFHPDSRA